MDRRTTRAWLATAAILVLCLWPRAWMRFREHPPSQGHADKLAHFAMFAAFGGFWCAAGRPSRTRVAAVLAAALALAGFTEWAQGLPVVDRDPDTLDALADVAGALVGVAWASARRPMPVDPADPVEGAP